MSLNCEKPAKWTKILISFPLLLFLKAPYLPSAELVSERWKVIKSGRSKSVPAYFFLKMWTSLKHEFFKLSFSRNRLIAWVEPLSSGCSPFYFTVAWWMLNFWGSFLNVPYNFQWSLQRSYWAAPTMPGFAVQDTHGQFDGCSILSLSFSTRNVAFLQYRIQTEGKDVRRPQAGFKENWEDIPRGMTGDSVSRGFSICWWSVLS